MIIWLDGNPEDKNNNSPWPLLLLQLHNKGCITTDTLLKEMGLDYDQEVKRIRWEIENGGRR